MTYLSKDISKWKLPDIQFNRLKARKFGPFFRRRAKYGIISDSAAGSDDPDN